MSTSKKEITSTGLHASAKAVDERTSVLVVDDSPFDRELVARLLAPMPDLELMFADSISAGTLILASKSPSIVITDLILPDGDGLEMVKRIRAEFPRTLVILMTAYGSEEVAIKALRAGAANYIAKRNITHDLVPTLRLVLDTASSSRDRARILRCMVRTESVFVLDNDPELIRAFMMLVQDLLIGIGLWDETGLVQVSIALQEAVTNAVFHGNLEVSSEFRQTDEQIFYQLALERRQVEPYRTRRVRIHVQLDGDAARFSVSDDGPGFDVSILNRAVAPEDLSRIGGRGLLLIRTFMDEVTFNAHGNQIIMIKNRQPAQPKLSPID